MATEAITKVIITRTQTAVIEKPNCNGVGMVTGSVKEIGEAMKRIGCVGCKLVFDTYCAPNFNRCFNAYVKRANRMAAVAGVVLSPPAGYFIDGHRQTDKWVMEVTE